MRKRIAIYKKGRRGRNDWQQRAAEFNDLASHAHRVAAVHHEKGDHQSGHEFSKRAMEYSAKAYQYAKQAHQESASFLSGTAKTSKRVGGAGIRRKKKA